MGAIFHHRLIQGQILKLSEVIAIIGITSLKNKIDEATKDNRSTFMKCLMR